MSTATAMPAPEMQAPSFLQAVRSFCKLLYDIGNEEVRAAAFIFENTICYQEFDRAKRITLDEFVNGRKRKDGTRLGDGCKITKRSHASEALRRLDQGGHLTILCNNHDKGRQQRAYALNLDCSPLRNSDEQDNITVLPIVPQKDTDCSPLRNSVFPDKELSVPSEGNSIRVSTSSKCLEEVPQEEETYAPSVRTSEESDVQGDAASPDLKAKRYELHETEREIRRLERAKLQGPYLRSLREKASALRLLVSELSHSHAPERASPPEQASDEMDAPGAVLYESPEQASVDIDETPPDAPELPADDEPDECSADEPDALFPEALPPEKEDWYGTVGGWFYDLDHVDARDKQTIMVAIAKIKARGYTSLEDMQTRFWRYRRKYGDLQRAGIMHFANNVQKA